jgi:guanine deaminase
MNDGCDDAGWLAAAVELADRHDAARGGFDDREFDELFARDRSTWHTPVETVPVPDAT